MNDATTGRFRSAADLRREFDASFAAPAVSSSVEVLRCLAIRVGDESFAVRLSDLAGLASRRKIVPLPAEESALLGIAGIQGKLVPVYSLGALLGHQVPEEPEHDQPAFASAERAVEGSAQLPAQAGWVAIIGVDEPVGLAFPELEGYIGVCREALHVPESGTRRYAREALRVGSGVRYILDLSSIVIAVRQRAGLRQGSGAAQ